MPTKSVPAANSHYITLQTAVDMTALYRTNREAMLDPVYQNKDVLPLNETFNRAAIEALLDLPGCAGIRIYGGQDDSDRVHSILVAVNAENEDILGSASKDTEDPVIVEVGQRCPPTCPPESPLNP